MHPSISPEKKHPLHHRSSNSRHRDKILLDREIGGRSIPVSHPGNFEREIFKSQACNNKRQSVHFQKDIYGHFGCVNAIEFSPGKEEFLASGGDDKRVLLWKTSELLSMEDGSKAKLMKGKHESNIFCLAFTSDVKQLLSSGNDHTVLVHNLETGEPLNVYFLEEAVYSISIHPDTDQIFVTACEDGTVELRDQRLPATSDPLLIASHRAPFQCATFNPLEGRIIATTNSRDGAQLWDVRRPNRCVTCYDVGHDEELGYRQSSCMSVHWDNGGERLLVLRRRMTPVLFHIGNSTPMAVFDSSTYRNSCTMKSCCFAGLDDEYVVSGSDNFNVFIWPTPSLTRMNLDVDERDEPILIKETAWELKGHRSIVNQVRYSKTHQVLASSGVEKLIKFWSIWPMVGARTFQSPRRLYTQQQYLDMIYESGGLPNTQDEQEARGAMEEDSRMLAFFDSLLRREMEPSSDESSVNDLMLDLSSSDTDSDSGSGNSSLQRTRRRHRRLRLAEIHANGPYSSEIVQSESSTTSRTSSTVASDSESESRTTESDYWDSFGGTDTGLTLPWKRDLKTLSDSELDRRHHGTQNGSSGRESGLLDNSCEVNRASIKGTGSSKCRKRYSSDSVLLSKECIHRKRLMEGIVDNLTGEEVRRRVEAAVALGRRAPPPGALARLANETGETDTDNIDDLHYNRPLWDFSSLSSDDMDDENLPATLTPDSCGRKKRTNQLGYKDSKFRKRPRIGSSDEATVSTPGTSAKRQYRRKQHQSSSSDSDSHNV